MPVLAPARRLHLEGRVHLRLRLRTAGKRSDHQDHVAGRGVVRARSASRRLRLADGHSLRPSIRARHDVSVCPAVSHLHHHLHSGDGAGVPDCWHTTAPRLSVHVRRLRPHAAGQYAVPRVLVPLREAGHARARRLLTRADRHVHALVQPAAVAAQAPLAASILFSGVLGKAGSGVLAATSSMSMPPSVEQTMDTREVTRSTSRAR